MTKIKIAVDLDSVLNNFEEHWIDKYNKMYDDNITVDDMVSWNFGEYAKKATKQQLTDIMLKDNFFGSLGLKDEYTYKEFKWLYENFDVYVVSSCHPSVVEEKVSWMARQFDFFDTRRFIACHYKGLIDCDWLIDDGLHNIKDFKNNVLVMNMPYNKDAEKYSDVNKSVSRVHTWRQIGNYFRMLKYTESLCGVQE